MKQINISVIIPVFTVPLEYMRACFDSLKNQTMQECEFVVVSDGAPEEESSICEEYVNKDARFKFFRREHAGVSAARNFGIEHAQGEYIVFVDSDDKTTKDFCSAIYSSAKKWNSDILLFEQNLENRNTVSTFSLFKHDIPLVSNLQYKNLIDV